MSSSKSSTSKNQKIQSKHIICSTDRISNLPESLITKILSLLSTKEAVATSVLSKIWKFAWTSITNVDFSDSHLFVSDFRRISAAENMEKKANFVNYINRVILLLNSPTIHKFSLSFTHITDARSIHNWIVAALLRDVKELYLNLKALKQQPMELPWRLYYRNTLEVLQLERGTIFNIPEKASIAFPKLRFLRLKRIKCGPIPKNGSICFPVLKVLRLIEVTYIKNDDSITRLLGKCPILEDLLIIRDDDDNLSKICICAPALRTAKIKFSYFDFSFGCKVHVDAPALQYLKIKNWIPKKEIIIKNQNSLNKAHFGLESCHDSEVKLLQNMNKLLIGLSGVKYLTVITGPPMESACRIPLFSNLIKLKMEMYCCNISVLQGFLENSINLHHLVYKKMGCDGFGEGDDDDDNDGGNIISIDACHNVGTCLTERGVVPKCLISTLKRIEIDGATGCPGDVALIKYMLKNAILLEKMIIRTDSCRDQNRRYKLLQKITMFPRGSSLCEVEYLS